MNQVITTQILDLCHGCDFVRLPPNSGGSTDFTDIIWFDLLLGKCRCPEECSTRFFFIDKKDPPPGRANAVNMSKIFAIGATFPHSRGQIVILLQFALSGKKQISNRKLLLKDSPSNYERLTEFR